MGLTVSKYGGTSLATLEQVRDAARATAAIRRAGHSVVVVVSARGGTTDRLLGLAEAAGGEAESARQKRERDQLLVTGECVSAALLALAVERLGVPAISLTGGQAGIVATGGHGAGVVSTIDTARLKACLRRGLAVIVAGFHGVDTAGDVVTLGRGGSDTTAVSVAAALGARNCDIYTDVPGVFSADPRFIRTARALPVLETRVMLEMALTGARVLHPPAVEFAAKGNIELRVMSPGDHDAGTLITPDSCAAGLTRTSTPVAVTHDPDVARLLLPERTAGHTAAWLLGFLLERGVHADRIPQESSASGHRPGFLVRMAELSEVSSAIRAAAEYHGELRVDEDVAAVSLIGTGLLDGPGYQARMRATLAAYQIPADLVCNTQLRMSAAVPRKRMLDAVEALHQEFALGHDKVVVDSATSA